ncbi:hypothetical protein HW445_21610, partial [Streptomyces sp. UH6]|nr:hypothetical protein [Streptomyces sp. UH6]
MHDDEQIGIPIFVDEAQGPVPPGDDVFYSDVGTRAGTARRARRVGAAVQDSYGPALDLAEQAVQQAAARFRAL